MSQSFTKWLMSASALLMVLAGLVASFLPQEILEAAGEAPSESLALLVQVLGALYLGFAMLNWMARGNAIGGVYSRPIVVGNFAHFLVAGLALLNAAAAGAGGPWLWAPTLLYAAFAAGFALLMFRHPARERAGTS